MYLYKTDLKVALLDAYLSSLMWLMGEWLVQGVWGHRCSMVRKTSWRAPAVLNRHPLVTKTPLAIYPQRFTIGFGSGEHAGCSKNITLFSWKRFLHQVKGPISTKDGGLHSWGIPAQMRPRVHISARCLMPLHELSLHCSTEVKKKHLAWGRDQPLVGSVAALFCPLSFRILSVQPQQPPEQFCHIQCTFALVSSCICILRLCLQPAYDPPM